MPGGMGPWQLAPGQVTDDGELSMCQLQGLALMEKGVFEPILIADHYVGWYTQGPYDIGTTTTVGFRNLARKDIPREQLLEYTKKNLKKISISNGSMMRSTPIAVYSHMMSKEMLRQISAADVNMTHHMSCVIDAVYLYQYAIGKLIKHADDPDRAVTVFKSTFQLC